jgi:peptidyl-prolyl cis-trans isomerase D
MISWIQRVFQQHFKWLFFLLLAVVIVSFVFVTEYSSRLGQRSHKIPDRPFFGINLSKADETRRLVEDAQLSLYLRQSPFSPQPSQAEMEQHALHRHAALHFAAQLGIPTPGSEAPEVAAYIQTLGRFAGPDGRFDPKAYASLLDEIKKNPRGFNENDLGRVILDDVRAEAFEKLLAGPGYVLPSDLAEQLARRDTRWTLAVAAIDGSAFAPRIDVSDTAVSAWFEQNARRYELGPRVSVAAVRFPVERHAASVTLTEAQIRAAYDANPARYPAPAAAPGEIRIDGPDADFAAVRAQVEADLRRQRAERAALTAADDLTFRLLDQGVTPEKLPAFLAAQNLSLEELGPVGAGSVPAVLGGDAASSRILPEVLRLAADRPFSSPIPVPDGAVVLVWRESLPSRVPDFAEVRDRVLPDYQAAERRRLLNEAGRSLRASVATALAAGKPFADAVSEAAKAAGLKAEVKKPEPFTLMNPPQDVDFTALRALEGLEKGELSEFLPSRGETGLLVQALAKDIPAFDPASPAAAEIKAQMAPILAARNAQGMLAALVEAELAKSAPASE